VKRWQRHSQGQVRGHDGHHRVRRQGCPKKARTSDAGHSDNPRVVRDKEAKRLAIAAPRPRNSERGIRRRGPLPLPLPFSGTECRWTLSSCSASSAGPSRRITSASCTLIALATPWCRRPRVHQLRAFRDLHLRRFVGVELLLTFKRPAGSTAALGRRARPGLAGGMAASGLLAVSWSAQPTAPSVRPTLSADLGHRRSSSSRHIRLAESLWRNAFNLVYPPMDALNHRSS